jgi:hypothetical protein
MWLTVALFVVKSVDTVGPKQSLGMLLYQQHSCIGIGLIPAGYCQNLKNWVQHLTGSNDGIISFGMLQTCQVPVRCVVGLDPTNFNKHGHRAAACHANFACCGQLLQNFLASPRKSAVSPSRLPRPGVEGNIPTDDLTYILDCDLTYTAPVR